MNSFAIASIGAAMAAVLLVPSPGFAEDSDRDRIIGNYANVLVRNADHSFELEAKVDTGADSTSIDARNIEEFERENAEWVRFEVPTGIADERIQLEAEVVDTVTIVSANNKSTERPVVELELCMGDFFERVEVNLADREGLDFRLLIGRGYLIDGAFLVNPAQGNEVAPNCEEFEEE